MSVNQSWVDSFPSLALPAAGSIATKGYVKRGRRLSVRLAWTGTPTGILSLQCSFDGGTTWQAVPGAIAEFTANGQAQPAGGAGSGVYHWPNGTAGGLWRINYAATSGTGTLTGQFEMGA